MNQRISMTLCTVAAGLTVLISIAASGADYFKPSIETGVIEEVYEMESPFIHQQFLIRVNGFPAQRVITLSAEAAIKKMANGKTVDCKFEDLRKGNIVQIERECSSPITHPPSHTSPKQKESDYDPFVLTKNVLVLESEREGRTIMLDANCEAK